MILYEDGTRKEALHAMWQENFHDPAAYAAFYFEEVYGKNEILLNVLDSQKDAGAEALCEDESEKAEETLCGMLHLNPYTLSVNGRKMAAHYIVGVATDAAYRRRGVMRALLLESFRKLRAHGEAFTYLMPADEAYYLPFDFRFGMAQLEQEFELLSDAEKSAEEREKKCAFSFVQNVNEETLSEISSLENARKSQNFAIHTQVDVAYLFRLQKEVESDFGQIWYVFLDEAYVGRFAVAAENDYLVLSQIFLVREEARAEFLAQAVRFCERKYHYKRYQWILDASWADVVPTAGRQGEFRFMPAKKVSKIMFRIVHLEELGTLLVAAGEGECKVFVEDSFLSAQSGCYRFRAEDDQVFVEKVENEEADGGRISVAALTEALFGENREKTLEETALTQSGRDFFRKIKPLSASCIMEIV